MDKRAPKAVTIPPLAHAYDEMNKTNLDNLHLPIRTHDILRRDTEQNKHIGGKPLIDCDARKSLTCSPLQMTTMRIQPVQTNTHKMLYRLILGPCAHQLGISGAMKF